MHPYREAAVKSKPCAKPGRWNGQVCWVDEAASSIIVTQSRTAGYMLAAVLGIFSAWLMTATVDAAKQALRPTYAPQAIVQVGP